MKTILSLLFCTVFCWVHEAKAQQFSPTAGIPCDNCGPTNYSTIHSPRISDVWSPSGSQVDKWNIQGPRLPDPPSDYSKGLPFGAGQYSFVTLKTSEGAYDDRLFINVSGFTVGQTYQLRYAALSASVHYEAGNKSPYGGSATITVSTTGPNAVQVETQTTDFDAFTRNQWVKRVLTFKATSTVHQFKLTGTTSGLSAGYINFSIDKYPFDCLLSPIQVSLNVTSPVNTLFPSDKLNLNAIPINGSIPTTGELVWKTGPNSVDPTLTPVEASSVSVSNLDPNNLKPYYAFFYAKDFNCYNVSASQAELKFMHKPTQVPLKDDHLPVSCVQPTANLNELLDNPAGNVIWLNSPNFQLGAVVSNPNAAPAGDYYAYYFDINKGGYSLKSGDISSAHVKIENPLAPGTPNLGPTLGINSLGFGPGAVRDFVVNIHNIAQQNSNCTVYFLVSKIPGYNIQYQTTAGQSDVDGGTANNNDKWTFSENAGFITVTSKTGMAAGEKSVIGFKISRNGGTTAGTTQTLNVIIPAAGGGGENVLDNNQVITAFTAN